MDAENTTVNSTETTNNNSAETVTEQQDQSQEQKSPEVTAEQITQLMDKMNGIESMLKEQQNNLSKEVAKQFDEIKKKGKFVAPEDNLDAVQREQAKIKEQLDDIRINMKTLYK